jgi:hypothetical protein
MIPEQLLSCLFISSVSAPGLAIIAMDYMKDLVVRDAVFMKYGVYLQIACFLTLCLPHLVWQSQEIFLAFMPACFLIGAGLFMLGVVSVVKAMQKARAVFVILAIGIQSCVVSFLTITTCLVR